ncbi:MAG: NUDIX domain-containing protein [Candidatus Moranbacteria bacterium]|nr:NUDIX domain-containing protein [Candidatus Moranbacteria bacterium]
MAIKNGAKVFIRNENLGEYLFVLRDNKPTIPNPGMYGLLGGGIEEGEQSIEALKRELQEESNICVYDIEEMGSRMVTYATRSDGDKKTETIRLFVFLAKTDQSLEGLKLNEGQKLEYFTIEEALSKDNLSPAVRESIGEYGERLRQ